MQSFVLVISLISPFFIIWAILGMIRAFRAGAYIKASQPLGAFALGLRTS